MKKILGLLTALLVSQIPSMGQLTLTIDRTSQTLDWDDGFTITRIPTGLDNNTFGIFVVPQVQILSPLLRYSGDGSHGSVWFQFSSDRTVLDGIRLGTDLPPGAGATFSGTSEGPAVPTLSSGDLASFASLNTGAYTLSPQGPWSEGIRVVVVPEPSALVLSLVGLGLLGLRRSAARRNSR